MRPDGRASGRGPTGPGWQPPPPQQQPGSQESASVLSGASIAGFSDSDGDAEGAEPSGSSSSGGGDGAGGSETATEFAEVSTRRALQRYGNYASKAARRAIELASSSSGEPQTAKVTFWLQFHVEWGQRLRVIGSHPQLGMCE